MFVFTYVQTPFHAFKAKNTHSLRVCVFLSNPQDWYIITARSAVYIISPSGCISSRFSVYSLRLDDIQNFVLMIYRNKLRMIYKACALILYPPRRDSCTPSHIAKTDLIFRSNRFIYWLFYYSYGLKYSLPTRYENLPI